MATCKVCGTWIKTKTAKCDNCGTITVGSKTIPRKHKAKDAARQLAVLWGEKKKH